MTLNDAIELIQEDNAPLVVRDILDFGSFWLFSLAPIYLDESEPYQTGTHFPTVDKKSGRIGVYDITSDLDAYEKAVKL